MCVGLTKHSIRNRIDEHKAQTYAQTDEHKANEIEQPAERLRYIQKLAENGNPKVREIFEKMGHYLAVAVVEFYDYFGMEHVVLFGRVTTGIAGEIIISRANQVLNEKFNDIARKVQLHLPVAQKRGAGLDREFGQAIASAYFSSMQSGVKRVRKPHPVRSPWYEASNMV